MGRSGVHDVRRARRLLGRRAESLSAPGRNVWFANRSIPCGSRRVIETNLPADFPACAGCARCCHLVVELRDGDDGVPEELVVEHDGVRCMDQHGDGACVALDPATRLCTIYEVRPQTCRDFTRGEALCRWILGRGPHPAH